MVSHFKLTADDVAVKGVIVTLHCGTVPDTKRPY